METEKWVLTPCTAPKSTEGSVAGDEPSNKRKAAVAAEGVCEAKDADEPGSFDPFGSQRRASAIDKMPREAKLPAAVNQPGVDSSAAAGKGRKYRLSKAEIWNIIVLKPETAPIADKDYLDDLAEFFPAEWIQERKLAHARFAEHDRKTYKEWKEFRQEVIKDLKEKGYYEVDEEYYANREKIVALAQEEWKKKDFSGFVVATEEEELQALKEGSYKPYVPDDEDDDLLDDLSSDDEDLIFRGFHGADDAHKVAAVSN